MTSNVSSLLSGVLLSEPMDALELLLDSLRRVDDGEGHAPRSGGANQRAEEGRSGHVDPQMYRQPYGPKAMREALGRQVSSLVTAAGGVRRGVEPARRFFRRERSLRPKEQAEQSRLL
jgi:hypothetical protein